MSLTDKEKKARNARYQREWKARQKVIRHWVIIPNEDWCKKAVQDVAEQMRIQKGLN